MLVIPGFSYQVPDMQSESGAIRERLQDFFDGFSLYGGCARCKGVVSITGFECA
jgi:hypothetical protein